MKKNIKEISLTFLIIIAVIALGLFAINQFLGYMYKVHFLKSPCHLCGELNPEVQKCIDLMNQPRPSYYIKDGLWSDPYNNTSPYNITIPLV